MTVDRLERGDRDLPGFLDSWNTFATAIADVVLLLRPDGEILAANRAPFGFDAVATIGRNVFDFAPADLRPHLRQSLVGIFTGDTATVREIPTQLPNGSEGWFATHTGLIYQGGQPIAAAVVLRDITEQKMAQLELRASEERYRMLVESDARLQTQLRNLVLLESQRDALVHMLVHDLRSPLSSLCANLTLVREDAEPLLPSGVLAYLRDAELLAEGIADMVSDMLDVSRFEEGAMPLVLKDTDLVSTATEAILAVPRKPRVAVRVEGHASEVPARCDRRIIMRVITNLVSNAVKATPHGGTVTVRVTPDRVVSVSDTGEGIPADIQAQIFDKFWRAPSAEFGMRRGSGLGLTFCKLAIEAHGGTVTVQSRRGEGSTFAFTLPQ
jgi:PAS domain S-box-containing protein